jgi:predicted nuclease of predicted toxin-antitoxin system
MQLLLDENSADVRLVTALQRDGHRVVRSIDAVGIAATDASVFAYAKANDLALLTYDCDDFFELHEGDNQHPGMLLIYRDGSHKGMAIEQIAKAIGNIATMYPQGIRSMVLPLPHFLW